MQQAGGDLGVLEQPDVAELAVVGAAGEAVVAALELEADLVLDDTRAAVAHGRRKLALPEVLGLHDVIVDGDDQREVGFGGGLVGSHGVIVAPNGESLNACRLDVLATPRC